MKIFRKKVDVDNLTELLQRKQRLADKMQQQRQELRQTLGALKEDLTPARLLKYTMRSFSKPVDSGLLNTIIQNPASIRLATDFAINTLTRNSKRARLLRILLPILYRPSRPLSSWRKICSGKRKVKRPRNRVQTPSLPVRKRRA